MSSQQDIAAQLIERLLTDPAFRANFRKDPAGTCEAAGLPELAKEMSLGAGNAMMTLDLRESKSSLAGVMMAAAMEGVGVFQFAQHVAPALGDIDNAVGDVLSRVNLPAISLPGRGALSGGNGDAPPAKAVEKEPEPPPPPAASTVQPAPPEAEPDPAEKPAAETPQAPEKEDKAAAAAAAIAEAEKPPSTEEKAAAAAAEIAESEKPELPDATALPEAGVASNELDGDVGQPPAEAQASSAPPPEPAERPKPDQSLYGLDGTGSAVTPEVKALLDNPKVTLDPDGVADLKAGKIDPRVVAVLTKLAQDHEITVTSMCSDHPRMSASGNVSNHAFGRGLDIGTVDGELVRPDSPAAREVAAALAELDPEYRPNEVGTPFAIAAPGYFTDAGHQDHIHLGFKEPIDSSWTPPAEVAAGEAATGAPGTPVAQAAAVSPPTAVPGAQAVPAAPAPLTPAGDSGTFMAVAADAAGRSGMAAPDSGTFLAVQPPAGPPDAVASGVADVPGAVEDAVASVSSGGGSAVGAKALETAMTQLNVREEGGANLGAKVGEFQAVTGAGPGTPWCASFVTWALAQNGRKMEGGGWAGVATWVQNAEQGKNGLEVVSAEDARPGDLVVYDWGGQDDFGADGHIGFLGSEVKDGKFTAVEGNWKDAVQKVPRQLGGTTNVKFLRLDGGSAPAGVPSAPDAASAAPPPAVEPQGTPASVELGDGANPYPGDDAPKEQIAAWMGREAEKRGLPPELPVMAGLVESNLSNLDYGDASSLGYFQMLQTIWDKGEYAGYADKPELQMKWFLDTAEGVMKQRVAAGKSIDDPSQFGEWIADTERPAEQYRGRYQLRLEEARTLLEKGAGSSPAPAVASAAVVPDASPPAPAPPTSDSGAFLAVTAEAAERAEKASLESGTFLAVQPPAGPPEAVATDLAAVPKAVDDVAASVSAGGGSVLGAKALETANTQLNVKEEGGANLGEKVGEFQAVTGAGPGTPWCASFVTWALQQNGHKMKGGGWAAVATWVSNAEQGKNNLKVVSAEEARPGDLVAYDWGGQDDFGSDGHIGFLASEVKGGKFTAVEGNWQDAVQRVPRQLGGTTNVKFLRIDDGSGPAPSAPAAPAAAPPVEPQGTPAPVELADGANAYPGDDAPKEQIAAWMGREAEKRGLPAELPVMAALVESNLSNLDYGDASSLGYFQMLQTIWDKGEYAGYADKPELQMKWFLDTAEGVMKQRESRGLPIDDPSQFGEWIADTERPAEQYRGRYQLRLEEARALLEKGAGSSAPPVATAATEPAAPAPATPAPEAPSGDSGAFLAVSADARSGNGSSDSGSFLAVPAAPVEAAVLPAVQPPSVTPSVDAVPAAAAPETASAARVDLTAIDGDYPGDNAPKEEVAAWLAKKAEEAGLPPQLPVMAALVESNLRNLNYGDADSVGFFQMRVGIWNRGEYAGFPEDPGLQAKWFIDQALAVKKQRLAEGLPVDDPSHFGEWIADVERPAEQYRGRYQLRLAEANNLLKQAATANSS